MSVPVLDRTLLSESDHWLLLSKGQAQADPRANAPGSSEVTLTSGMPAQPYQAGHHDLTATDSRDA